MNKAEWDAMDGDKRVGLVAENVMGWIVSPSGDSVFFHVPTNDEGVFNLLSSDEFKPTTDRNACALVLDEIEKHGLTNKLLHGLHDLYLLSLGFEKRTTPRAAIGWEKFTLRADPDTICYCAVKAVSDVPSN